MTIESLIAERDKTHGNWSKQAQCAQSLKNCIRRAQEPLRTLSKGQMEAIEMVLVKASRIACGNPNEPDHWDDIIGYAMLGKMSDPL